MIKASALSALLLTACASGAAADPQTMYPKMLQPIDLSTPQAATHSMMRAMYQADADMVDQVFIEGAQLRRVTAEGEIRPDGLQRWRDWVGSLQQGDAYEELFALSSEQLGPLATVWAPFLVTYQGDLVGCGVNQLTLAKTDGEWRVVFAMDTSEPKETCGDFKARYLASLD
jgi:hypothetical protein